VQGFQHSIIFDQTEVSTIVRCHLIAGESNGSCVWLANGNYTIGADLGYTNRITISQCELNAVSTATANIIDDGGVNCSIIDNNLNAGLIGVRSAGRAGLVITGNESEAHGTCDIYLADTTSTGEYVGSCVSPVIRGNVPISGGGGANIMVQSCEGGEIVSNHFGQAATAISLVGGSSNKAKGLVIEANTKLVRGAYKTAGTFVNGFAGPLANQVIRQGANTYVTSSQSSGSVTVTPATMELIQVGTRLYCENPDGTNGEAVTVTAVTASTFIATFTSSKSANWVLTGVEDPIPSQGEFTPVIVGTGSAGTGTYTYQVGRYQKIGNRVFFSASVEWTAHTGTVNMFVGGLPFTSANIANVNQACAVGFSNITLSAGNYLTASIPNLSTAITLLQVATGGGSFNLVPIDPAGTVFISGHYEV